MLFVRRRETPCPAPLTSQDLQAAIVLLHPLVADA